MVDGSDAFTTTRRGALKTGAIGLGGLTGALAIGGSQQASASPLPSMGTLAALGGDAAGMFLKLDGIPGDSQAEGHVNWIQVSSVQFGAANSTSVTGSGWSSSKPSISRVAFTALSGRQSAPLFLSTLTGRRLARATFELLAPGPVDGPARKVVTLEMGDVAVSDFDDSASEGGGAPQESFSLTFATIRFAVFVEKGDGTLVESAASWNVRTSTGTNS